MKRKQTKVLNSNYLIKVNGEPLSPILIGNLDTLSKARKQVKKMIIDDRVQEVAIVRQTVTETVMDTFKPIIQKVLTADDLSLDEGDINE